MRSLDRVEIHIGGAVVAMKSAGVYRFDADRVADAPRLRVFSGQALVCRRSYRRAYEEAYRFAKPGETVRLQDLHRCAAAVGRNPGRTAPVDPVGPDDMLFDANQDRRL
jgi:hypothetical protein